MPERRGHEPTPLDDDRAAVATACPARLPLHVGHGLLDGSLVRANDLSHHLRLGDREQDPDALRRPEGQVEARDRAGGKRP